MANKGNKFIVVLTESQLGWGEKRYTSSRNYRKGEAYLARPRRIAQELELYNSNYKEGKDILGINIFNCTSSDGKFICQFKSQGSKSAGDKYAKQFSVNDDLRALGNWYSEINARVGDQIEVYFTSPCDICLTYLKK